MELKKLLRERRKKMGLSQRQVSVLIGVSKQMVQKYESGVAYPSTERLLMLAKELNFSVNLIDPYKKK